MASRTRVLAAAAFATLWAPAATAQPHGAVHTLEAVRVAAAPRIDGHLDDAAWRDAKAANGFLQRDPDEGKPATEQTELRIVYDSDAIYVGVRLHDREASRIVRRLTRRDDVPDADSFSIFFDPHHDHLTGAVFTVSAAGSQSDAVLFNDSWNDGSWDAVWDAAVSIDAEGWSAEMRIPFSQLRFGKGDRDAWGVNAARFIQRRNETAWLQLMPKKEAGVVSRMAHLTGIRGIAGARQIEVTPYSVARAEFVEPDAPGNPFNDGSRTFAGIGLDAKYGLSSSFTLNAAINPDFGQVEVDPAVVNLTAFETFFDEKRPFFIEGAQIFNNFGRSGANSFWGFNNYEPSIFYSRRIGRSPQGDASADFVERPNASTILGAAKLTGKTSNGWNIGVLDAVTAREYARLSGTDRDRVEIEPVTNYFVGRIQRELKRTAFGMLGTWVQRGTGDAALPDLLPSRAVVVAADGHVFLDSKRDWVVTGMLGGSRISGTTAAMTRAQEASLRYFQRPDARRLDPSRTSLSGWNSRVSVNRNSGLLQLNAAWWAVSPGFDSNDAGFGFRSGMQGVHAVVLWRKPTPDRFTRARSAWVSKFWTWDSNRVKHGDGIMGLVYGQFLNYWSATMHAIYQWRALDGWEARGGPLMTAPAGAFVGFGVDSDDRKPVTFGVNGSYSRNEFDGRELSIGTTVQLKPVSSIRISLQPQLNRSRTIAQYVKTTPDDTATATYGSRYVFSDLKQAQVSMSTRATWVMTPRMSLQVYSQPLLATGDYWNFKSLAAPRTYAFDPFGGEVGNPDFNFKSLRVNAVYRWEWRLGSTLYVVWTEQREDTRDPGTFAFGRDARALFRAAPDDVFMVKVSYWLSR